MTELLLQLITALLFYFIGYYSGRYEDIQKKATDFIKKGRSMSKRRRGLIIDYPTPEQVAYNGSEQEKIDREQEKLLREAGLS